MLTLKNIRKVYGIRRVLEKVSFSLGEGQKAAIVGQNGVGKSTLLRLIARIESPDRGEILVPNRALIGYLPQEALADGGETLRSYLRRMAGLGELEDEMKELEPRLEKPASLARYELLEAEYRRLGGYDFERRSKNILAGLYLSHIALDRPVVELSGGEKRKAALAGVLLRGVDILLLDEPTNNLDLPALLWLEKYLSRSKATCLIASHDRRFLDNVVSKIIELDWFKRDVTMYTGGWSEFAEMKAHAHRRHKEQYRMQQEERDRLFESKEQKMDWVERVKNRKAPDHDKLTSNFKKERATKKFTNSAKALEGREKRLDDVERPLERIPLVIPLKPKTDIGLDDILLKKVRFGYKNGFQGGPIDLEILYGTRISILGDNGVGKSTLLKTIAGEIEPLKGKVVRGDDVVFGYLMQEHENIASEAKISEIFKKRLDIYDRDEVVMHLTRFQFPPDIIDDKVSYLSPGERVRLILSLLSALGANVLVLDEPTNHLDLETIEALEESLELYPGTILLVTHDRYFLGKMRIDRHLMLLDGALSPVESYEAYAAAVTPKADRILKRLEER
jgi:ATPase subunit of ABC transporter with duplicated ATPase domains